MYKITGHLNVARNDAEGVQKEFTQKVVDNAKGKAIEEFLGRIEERFLGVHPDELYWRYAPKDIMDTCREIAGQMKGE